MFSKSALAVSSKWQIFTCFGCFCTLIRRKREICQTFYPIISGWYKCARWLCNSALKLDKTYSVSRLYMAIKREFSDWASPLDLIRKLSIRNVYCQLFRL